jgi:hypothetical protein
MNLWFVLLWKQGTAVTEQEPRHSTLLFYLVQHAHHVVSLEALAGVDRRTLPRVNIYPSQYPEAPTEKEKKDQLDTRTKLL